MLAPFFYNSKVMIGMKKEPKVTAILEVYGYEA